jgi:hypothetical protein
MYLFFVRHFNDIDHIAPIVWKMHQHKYPVAVYCINPQYDIHSDYRLTFLQRQGVTVDFVHKAFDRELPALHRAAQWAFQWLFAQSKRFNSVDPQSPSLPSRLAQLVTEIVAHTFYQLTRLAFYNRKWAHSLLERTGARALCFDHVIPKRNVVGVLLTAANERSIPTLALPHGVYLYTNEFYKAGSTAKTRFDKFNRYDYILVQTQLRKDVLVRAGLRREKVVVMGSARFCAEWISQNRKILPRVMKSSESDTTRLKVAFMTSKPQCRIDVDRMLGTADILSNLSGIDVMIKPHTRIGALAQYFYNLPAGNASNVLTPELCEWADVVLVIGSSVITEALMQRKPVLYLKYLHANTMLFEESGACWTIHNEAELKTALRALQLRKADIPYSDENVDRFLLEVVYGDRNDRDVLEDYVEFIVNSTAN